MSVKPATAEQNVVTLIRQGIGREEYTLAEGATLAELLQKARAQAEGQIIHIDGKTLEEQFLLQSGMIVTVETPRRNSLDERWRDTIGMFHDDSEIRELVEAVEATREAEKDRS